MRIATSLWIFSALVSGSCATAAAPPAPTPTVRPARPPLDLSDRVIRKAIADAREAPTRSMPAAVYGTSTSPRQSRIDAAFAQATIPQCLREDALRFDPPTLGPIGFGGFLSAPWVLHAMASGKCRM